MVPSAAQAIKKAKKLVKRKQTLKFTVDCSQPVDDGIMDAASFVRASAAPIPRRWVGLVDGGRDDAKGPTILKTLFFAEASASYPTFFPRS